MTDTHLQADRPIMFFDGECALCNGTVNFVLNHEREATLLFAALQSDLGQQYLKKFGLPQQDFQSYMIVEGEDCYLKAAAVERMAHHMGGFWRNLGNIASVIPRPIGDAIYAFGFRNRIRWFGKVQQCRVPDTATRQRFLAL